MKDASNPPLAGPGWPELVVGAVAYAAAYAATPYLIDAVGGGDPVIRGLAAAALSGIIGLVGFAAAVLVRRRPLSTFGIRRVPLRWVLIAVGLGLLVFIVSRVVFAVLIATGTLPDADPQESYRAAGASGLIALTLQLLFIAVLTPLGEEVMFRGLLVSSLRGYGAVLSVIVSVVLFAVAHGWNLSLIPATLVGITSAVLLLRTGSVWPGVIVHAVNNGLATVLAVIAFPPPA